MSFGAKVLKDSVSEDMVRLPTVLARFPRFILPEVLTHRVFSRNTSSSRAIPVKKIIADIMEDTAMPVSWGLNKPGMSAEAENNRKVYIKTYETQMTEFFDQGYSKAEKLYRMVLAGFEKEDAWLAARDAAIEYAMAFNESEYHKQVVNRILEPYVHTNMVISSTYWRNFFNLRLASDAQPEINVLAEEISNALSESKPRLLGFGQWHLPYVPCREEDQPLSRIRKFSAARLARVSYNNHDGTEPSAERDLKTFDMLINEGGSLHGSCFEHIATPVPNHRASNFFGWMQWRELLDKNNPYQEFYTGEYNSYGN